MRLGARNWFLAAAGLALSLTVGGCKTGTGSTLRDDVTGAPPAADPASVAIIESLDKACGGSCHNADDEGRLPFATLRRFAQQTYAYHVCFEQNGCNAATIPGDKAAACWSCVTGSGSLAYNGGVYQAAIRKGLIRRIAEAAGKTEDLNKIQGGNAMPPSRPRPDKDLTTDDANFLKIAAWLASQPGVSFAGIQSVRPKALAEEGAPGTCDDIPATVTSTFRPDFQLAGVNMFGCPKAWEDDPLKCLASFPDADFADAGVAGNKVKVLRRLDGRPRSSYWMRSSADGRFASLGNGRIEDLKTKDRSIEVTTGNIDPFYYPDNKFYTWPSMICPSAPLFKATTTKVGTDQPDSGCVERNVEVYGAAGTDTNGDMLVTGGNNYSNNNPGSGTPDAIEFPGADGTLEIRRFRGTEILDSAGTYATPFETDFQMGPSGQILVGRVRLDTGDQAYRVRAIRPDGSTIKPDADGAAGTICMKGEKANVSFDNRFIAFHHYNDGSAQDAGANPNHANIFVYDLKAKKGYRVTNMKDADAYYPHWRADGWLYFQIKNAKDGVEAVAASNIAMILSKANP